MGINAILDMLFPTNFTCFACAREAEVDAMGLCIDCAKSLRIVDNVPPIAHVDDASAAIFYDFPFDSALARFKYQGEKQLASYLASLILLPPGWDADIIVPIPLYEKRYRKRGFNQSELIAAELSKDIGVRVDTRIMHRTRDTNTQTELTKEERAKNMQNAFHVNERLDGLRILLLDDVFTTGATLSDAARALKEAGAACVLAITVLYADPNRQ